MFWTQQHESYKPTIEIFIYMYITIFEQIFVMHHAIVEMFKYYILLYTGSLINNHTLGFIFFLGNRTYNMILILKTSFMYTGPRYGFTKALTQNIKLRNHLGLLSK